MCLKRSFLSILVGLCTTFLPLVVITNFGFPEKSKWDGLLTGIAVLNYWPSWILHPPLTTIDCPNADSIRDKLECMWICFVITTITYSILRFALLSWLASRKQTRI